MTADNAQGGIAPTAPPVAAGRILNYAPTIIEPDLPVPPEWTGVEEFRLAPERMQGYLIAVISFQVGTFAVFGLLVISYIVWSIREASPEIMLTSVALYVTIIGALQGVKVVRLYLLTRKEWLRFRLIVADQGLLIANYKKSVIRVDRSQVLAISEKFDSLQLQLQSGAKYAHVPTRVAGAGRVRERLSHWQPITRGHGLAGVLLTMGRSWLLAMAALAVMVLGNGTESIWVLTGCAAASWMVAALIAIPVWRSMTIRRGGKIIVGIYFLFSLELVVRLVMMLAQVSGT